MFKYIYFSNMAKAMKYRNLTIIGTSHIARQSVEEVRKAVEEGKPDIVCLELDQRRLAALSQKRKGISLGDIRHVGFAGWLLSLIGGYVEKRLGESVGILPGAEMMAALDMAKQHRLRVYLIDQDIMITLKRFSKAFSLREKFRLLGDLVIGLFFRKRELKKLGLKKLDLTKVPDKKVIKRMIKEVKCRYPNLYRVLVEERNVVMAKNLSFVIKMHPESGILAVLGAGHEEELLTLIKKYNKIIKLKNTA